MLFRSFNNSHNQMWNAAAWIFYQVYEVYVLYSVYVLKIISMLNWNNTAKI